MAAGMVSFVGSCRMTKRTVLITRPPREMLTITFAPVGYA